jgi:hypothetical protein
MNALNRCLFPNRGAVLVIWGERRIGDEWRGLDPLQVIWGSNPLHSPSILLLSGITQQALKVLYNYKKRIEAGCVMIVYGLKQSTHLEFSK